jgi:hypothetical protein
MSVKPIQEVKYFVNQPVGGIIPDDKLPSDYVRVGSYVEPKIGCCDNGNKTREDRVIIVFDEVRPLSFGNHTILTGDDEVRSYRVYNRRGGEYRVPNGVSKQAIAQLSPLYRLGFRVFDCGFFPQGKRAGDLVIYGCPMERYHEGIRTYTEMREVMERYYHVYLDKRIIYQFQILQEKVHEAGYPCLNGVPARPLPNGGHVPINLSVDLRDHSNGRVTPKGFGVEGNLGFKQGEDPYWWDLQDKADLGPQVYILPAWKPGPYLDTVWRAMKECPETTYEGMVIKPANQGQFYTHDKPSSTWMKIRNR